MKSAILYVRVSTDEQADKGYSQRNQDEVLQRYCAARSITIAEVIYEDHSAKTFHRPAWIQMLSGLKKAKPNIRPTLILFTKWDRFSRNTADAYQMIGQLNAMNIEPQAVEQPIDLSVPENKMMLAIYLSVPEVENDRRGLNIFYGIRRAKKEGRWMGHAPVGYENKCDESGRKYIRPNLPQARLMKQGFEEIATGKIAVEHVWKKLKLKGLKSQSNNFHTSIRNPLYCGKIIVPAFQDEPMQLVEGQHEPIITEALFLKVQSVLNGKKAEKTTTDSLKQYPLRGYLKCERCARMLTASGSRGRNTYYFYYHCQASCGIRHKANLINDQFINFLAALIPNSGFKILAKEIARDVFKQQTADKTSNRLQLISKLDALNSKRHKMRELLVEEKLDQQDYLDLRADYSGKIAMLLTQLEHMPDCEPSITKILNKYASELLSLNLLFGQGSTEDQRRLIAATFHLPVLYERDNFHETLLSPGAGSIFRTAKNQP
jgi:site-specific DNA recombinase